MGINFAGVDLLLEDREGRVAEWVDHYIDLDDVAHISAWPGAVWNKPNGLTQPNWSGPKRPKIGTFYSPLGCSRWGYGFYLATSQMITTLIANGALGGSFLKLVDDGNRFGRVFIAYMLPPHPVSANNFDPNALWILPLVDARWWWQFKNFGDGGIGSGIATALGSYPTFSGLVGLINLTLPSASSSIPTIPTAYLNPDQWAFTKLAHQNAAVASDILLESCGLRLVPYHATLYGGQNPWGGPNTGGTNTSGGLFIFQNYASAFTTLLLNSAGGQEAGALQAGFFTGNENGTSNVIPSSVTVSFRSSLQGVIDTNETHRRYSASFTAAGLGFTLPTGSSAYTKEIRSTALAEYSYPADFGGAGPGNGATLTALAQQIATDFYGWRSVISEQTFIGITQRSHTGYDDYWEYSLGHRRDDGSYEARSRVHAMPYNYCCDDLLHFDPTAFTWQFNDPTTLVATNYNRNAWQWGNVVFGTLQNILKANNQQVISITSADVPIPQVAQSDATTNAYLLVSEVEGVEISGGKVAAIRDGDKWAVIGGTSSSSTQLRVQPTADTLGGASPLCNVVSGTPGSEVATGLQVSPYVRFGIVFQGKTYLTLATSAGFELLADQWCFVKNVGADIPKGSPGTVNVITGTQGAEAADGLTITVLARWGSFKTNAIGRAVVDNTTNTLTWTVDSTDTC